MPVALASGWSGAVLFAIRIPLNPMSVTLGALVVAIATEFSVLLSARYAEERARGVGPAVALERTYASTGAAVIASGVTAIAGFAVLISSNIAMLRAVRHLDRGRPDRRADRRAAGAAGDARLLRALRGAVAARPRPAAARTARDARAAPRPARAVGVLGLAAAPPCLRTASATSAPRSRRKQSAAERFAELDATDPEPKPKRPEAPRPSGRYTWVFGVAALIVIVVVGIKVAQNGTGASLRGPTPGTVLPAFAAPAAIGGVSGDANVKQHQGDSNSAGKQQACAVHGPGVVVNSCDLRSQPTVLTFIVTRGADCTPQLDRIEAAQKRYPGVKFAAVVSGNKTEQVAKLAKSHGWTFPVGVDHDGAVVNLYSIGVCPSTVFANQGGRVAETKLGNLDDRDLAEGIARITRK